MIVKMSSIVYYACGLKRRFNLANLLLLPRSNTRPIQNSAKAIV